MVAETSRELKAADTHSRTYPGPSCLTLSSRFTSRAGRLRHYAAFREALSSGGRPRGNILQTAQALTSSHAKATPHQPRLPYAERVPITWASVAGDVLSSTITHIESCGRRRPRSACASEVRIFCTPWATQCVHNPIELSPLHRPSHFWKRIVRTFLDFVIVPWPR